VGVPIRPLRVRDPGSTPVDGGGLDSPKPLNGIESQETVSVQPQVMFSSDITFRRGLRGHLCVIQVK